jgi:hypothetical protein
MFEKKLKDLLVLVEGNEQVIENAVAKFSYTYNIAKEMVDVYNYIVKTLEDCNVELPINIVKIDTASFGQDCKEIFEVISYRNGLLSVLIKNEISNASDQYAFENLDKFERSERKRISEKIKVLELPLPNKKFAKYWNKKSYVKSPLGSYVEKFICEYVKSVAEKMC